MGTVVEDGSGRSRSAGRLIWAAVLTAVMATAGIALAEADQPAGTSKRRPDIQILLVDTLRADRLGTYGAKRSTDPNLQRLALSSVVFEQTWATASWTLPSTASVLTGTYPSVHGVRAKRGSDAEVHTLRDGVTTLAEALRAEGYYTIALIANFWLEAHHGLDRGFDHYTLGAKNKTPARTLHKQARALLEKAPPDKPVFLYLHYLDVHAPYTPADVELAPLDPEIAERQLTKPQWSRMRSTMRGYRGEVPPKLGVLFDAYDKGIYRWDRDFGAWLEWLRRSGRFERTVLAVTSDHGEEFAEHGGWLHGGTLYEEQIRVPWVLHAPGLAPARVDRPTSIADIAPTVLSLAGIEVPKTMHGVTQVRPGTTKLAEGKPDRAVFAELSSDGGGVWGSKAARAARRGDQKVIGRRAGYISFDLSTDPREKSATPAAKDLVDLVDELHDAYNEVGEGLGDTTSVEMSDELKERLRALGYDLD